MELTIDGLFCDLGDKPVAVPGYDAAKTADPEACREGRSLEVTLPPTPQNDAAVGFARDPHTAERFNAALHTATLTAEGATLLEGTVRLVKTSDEGYTLEIRDGGARWARNAARRMFNTLGIDYEARLTPMTILTSWTDTSPVKFFPIIRDEYPQLNSSQDLLVAERQLSVDDYHPFLHIATLVGKIFSEAGYRTESRFLESEFFQSLYMSGAYTSRDTTAAAARMGFFARRLGPATAAANFLGRVDADGANPSGTLGNIVDTATPQTLDADGQPIPELFNNGGCFSKKEGMIVFTPPTEVSAGFEFFLKFTTDHRIQSRTRLKGFDSVYLGPGAEVAFSLANRYKDRRESITSNFLYLVIVFNHASGDKYRLSYTRNGIGDYFWATFSTRSAKVSIPATQGVLSNPLLQVERNGQWVTYTDDWALYDGYIEETGQTTVDLRVRTPAEILSPSSPKFFNQIYFSGAEMGMTLKLHKECSLQPRFVSSPGFGSAITFADVAQHRIRQVELLEALAHLFNLRFYTEEATRTVYIEPAADFFGAGLTADWRAKSDFSQPLVAEDLALNVHESRTWSFREGDGAVKRFEAEAESPLGQWTAQTDSQAAKEGEQKLQNPLFRPTLNTTGRYSNAPSAHIMLVGDRDDMEEDGSNFTPRIVRFAGMKRLPGSERWGYPSSEQQYPLAAFHFAGDDATAGFTLGFEDRDGIEGLHRFYDRQIAQESARERITLSLHLAPHEFESLFAPGTGAPDIRSTFLLDTGVEPVRGTLHAVGDYDPAKGSVRCAFTRSTEE